MVEYLSDVPLSRFCTFAVGGKARRLGFAYNRDELAAGATAGALVLGRGSNVLFGDCGYDGDVLVNRTSARRIYEDVCECDSGVLLSQLAREYAAAGREGLSWAYGLPGTVGGAVVGNAGAFGGCMADVVLSVRVVENGRWRELDAAGCGFAYRHSEIPGTVLSVTLRAPCGDAARIEAAARENLRLRREKQPLGASAGSVFCAAGEQSAGALIEQAGLKGKAAGGAVISEKHANFILNRGGCSAADVLQLINTAQATVYDRFGIRLVREIHLLGEFF